MAAVPVVWVHDDAALADAAFALTKLRTQPVSTSAPVKKSSKNSGGSVRSGELSPTTPALETTHSPFQPPAGAAPSGPRDTTPLLEVAADEVDLPMSEEDEGPRHGDGDGAGAYGHHANRGPSGAPRQPPAPQSAPSPTPLRRRRSWTREEDDQVRRLVAEHGLRKWAMIASCLGTKSQKQVYARYRDYLAPTLVDSAWTPEEHATLFELHSELGNRWSEITKRMPGRSPNAIKNRYNACLRKRQRHASRGQVDMDMS